MKQQQETNAELTKSAMITFAPGIQLTILSYGSTVTIPSRDTLHRLTTTTAHSYDVQPRHIKIWKKN